MRILVGLLDMRQVVEERVDSSHVTVSDVWGGGEKRREREVESTK